MKKIVIIEDHHDFAYVVEYWLNEVLGKTCEIINQTNGRTAWQYIRTHPVDLVIADNILPDLEGVQICTLIKRNTNLRKIPVILITSIPRDVFELKANQAQADRFFQKPLNMEEFIAEVKKLLNL